VLRPGGRAVIVEPAITWGSTLFYLLMHPEPVRMSADILRQGQPDRTAILPTPNDESPADGTDRPAGLTSNLANNVELRC